jgi:hypothetical protein
MNVGKMAEIAVTEMRQGKKRSQVSKEPGKGEMVSPKERGMKATGIWTRTAILAVFAGVLGAGPNEGTRGGAKRQLASS